MEKLTIYLDCDDTILYSSEAVIRILNKRYGLSKTIDDLKDWGYRSIVPTITQEEIAEIYGSKEFWREACFNREFLKVYKRLRKQFNWVIVSRGTPENLAYKQKMLKRKMGGRTEFDCMLIVPGDKTNGSKGDIDMTGGIQIDDAMGCLEGTTAAIRILFRAKEGYWNRPTPDEDNLYVVHNWQEIGEMLAFFNEHREFVKREY